MFEIFKVSIGEVIFSGLTLGEAQILRASRVDMMDLIIRLAA